MTEKPKSYRPHAETIRKIVKHFEELGLSVYGANMDVDQGYEFPSLMDYDAEAIIKRRRHIEKGTLEFSNV